MSGAKHCRPRKSIYNTTTGYEFFKVPFTNGTTIEEGSVVETCAKANMKGSGTKLKAVCNGDSQCPENSGSCLVTPLSLTCGNCVLDELSKRICNDYNPRNCKELEGVFSYNGLSGGECGIVNGSYFSHGRTYVSGDPDIFHALCRDCHGTSCSGKYKLFFPSLLKISLQLTED